MRFHQLAQLSLDDACSALLPGLSATPCDSDPALCRAAIIGFAGDDVRGNLGIATSQSGLERVLAASGASEDAEHCERTGADDSLGELANLLVGTIKRTWLRREVEITVATPLVVRGLAIEVCSGESGQWVTIDHSNGSERITAWLDIHCDESLQVPDEDSSEDFLAEGQPLLF